MKNNNIKSLLPLLLFFVCLSCIAQDTTLTKKQLRKKQREYGVGFATNFEMYPLMTNTVITDREKLIFPSNMNFKQFDFVEANNLQYKQCYSLRYGINYEQNLPFISKNLIYNVAFYFGDKGEYYFMNVGYYFDYDIENTRVGPSIYCSPCYFSSKINYLSTELTIGYKFDFKNFGFSFNTGLSDNKYILYKTTQYSLDDNSVIGTRKINRKVHKENFSYNTFKNFKAKTEKRNLRNEEKSEYRDNLDYACFIFAIKCSYDFNHFKLGLASFFRLENRVLPIPNNYKNISIYKYLYNYKKTDVQLTTQLSINYAF